MAAAQDQATSSSFWTSRQAAGGGKPGAAAANPDGRVSRGQVIGPDDRQRINPTSAFPWRAVVSLEVDFDFGATGGYCSGAVIGPTAILTAGHCVYDPTTVQGWATGIRVIPGRNGTAEPFGSQIASDLLAPTGYVSNGTPALDVGIVLLPNSTLTSQTGRFHFMGGNGSSLIGNTANIAGYPGENPTQQWWHAGPLVDRSYSATSDIGILSYPIDTSGGQSGSPIWLFNGSDRVIVGIHTRGETSTSCSNLGGANNCGTLITSFIASQLESVGADTRVTPSGPFIPETLPGATSATPTPTVSVPTQTPGGTGTIGGRGLALQSTSGGVQLTWQDGTIETGYLVLRLAGPSVGVLPSTGPLPGDATSFLDSTAPPGIVCYIVVALGGVSGGALGASDLLCAAPNTHSATGAPQSLTMRLNQSNIASLSWGAPLGGGANGFLLFPLGSSGIPFPNTTTSTSLALSSPTCYVLFATVSGIPVGNSDIVCGIPGASTVGTASAGG